MQNIRTINLQKWIWPILQLSFVKVVGVYLVYVSLFNLSFQIVSA